jgi:hypothetical protein
MLGMCIGMCIGKIASLKAAVKTSQLQLCTVAYYACLVASLKAVVKTSNASYVQFWD